MWRGVIEDPSGEEASPDKRDWSLVNRASVALVVQEPEEP